MSPKAGSRRRAQEPRLTRKQVNLILNGTDKDWERYISRYARGKRMPELEPYIAQRPEAAYCYARWAIKGRWPEAEPTIAADPGWAFQYAVFVIRGRWPEGEPAIKRRAWAACLYVIHVIRGRWPEAEPYIIKEPAAWHWYTELYPEANT